jgi:hypothetical protein
MSIIIHGKEYITVAERLKMLHDRKDLVDKISISSEVLSHNPVVIKVTLKINEQIFEGISAANPNKPIEKQSPYEVAQSSALGRALSFSGIGLSDNIASADEMIKAEFSQEDRRPAKSVYMTHRSIEDHESGQVCQKCGSSHLIMRTSNSANSAGKEYFYCQAHKGFSHWVNEKAKV